MNLFYVLLYLYSSAKVNDLDRYCLIMGLSLWNVSYYGMKEHKIVQFNVSVDDVLWMHEGERTQQLFHYPRDSLFGFTWTFL
jgi:hypothetical protein